MLTHCLIASLCLLLSIADYSRAQATAPSTQAAPYVMTIPPGMKLIQVNQLKIICVPELSSEVQKQVSTIKPATRPTTLPSDVVATLTIERARISAQFARDLGVKAADVDEFLNTKLIGPLGQLAAVKPNLYFLLATNEQMSAAIKAGWTNPRFRLNSQDSHVLYDPHVAITPDRAMDDITLMVEYKSADSPETAVQTLSKSINDFQATYVNADAGEAVISVRNLILAFLQDNVVKPLNLKPEQEWFGMGLISEASAIYTAQITGMAREELVASLSQDIPGNPIPASSLDLVNPATEDQIKPQYLIFIRDAMRRKATRVIDGLVKRDGDAIVFKLVDALRTQKPATNADLIKLIQTTSGVDIAPQLAPK